MKWNIRTWTNPYYRKSKNDIADEFKRLNKNRSGAYSTDEDDDEDSEKVFGVKETVSVNKMFDEKVDGNLTFRENADIDDSDNDD